MTIIIQLSQKEDTSEYSVLNWLNKFSIYVSIYRHIYTYVCAHMYTYIC